LKPALEVDAPSLDQCGDLHARASVSDAGDLAPGVLDATRCISYLRSS